MSDDIAPISSSGEDCIFTKWSLDTTYNGQAIKYGLKCIRQQEQIQQTSSDIVNFLNLKAKLELAGGKFDKVEMWEIEPGNVTMVATENIA